MTVLAQIGKLLISIAYLVIYVYVAEMFPSSVRTSAMSACITVGKTANITAPYVVALVSSLQILLLMYEYILTNCGYIVLVFLGN